MEIDRNLYKRVLKNNLDSNAFSLEYKYDVISQALKKDIHTYLGEYRFNIPKSKYKLIYADGHIRNVHGLEPMQNVTQRAIDKREFLWKNTDREKAEYDGISSLDEQMKRAKPGDTIIWASPPGLQEDGYGDYGFLFVGKIGSLDDLSKKIINMSALRLERPSILQFNKAFTMITGHQYDYQKPEDFLAHPVIINGSIDTIEELVAYLFEYNTMYDYSFYQEALRVLDPAISSFINLIKNGADKKELKERFNVIENLSDKITSGELSLFHASEYSSLSRQNDPAVYQLFGKKPKPVLGSCGSTGKRVNILEQSSFIQKLLGEDDDDMFTCPSCHQKSRPPIGDSCPKCRYTKQEHKRKEEAKGKKTC